MLRKPDLLLGREHELDILVRALDRAVGGQAVFAFVAGEAGVGKTRLLEELATDAIARGCLTARGRAVEFEREMPFALFADALDAHLASLDERTIDRLTVDRLGALSAVFPSLHALHASVDVPLSTTERFRVHRAVRELLERLAASRPVVLVLDDVHWADGASFELLLSLLRRPPQGAVMMAMTCRNNNDGVLTRHVLADLHHAAGVEIIELDPLPYDVIRQMISELPESATAQLFEQSGGNPFFALQLAKAHHDASTGSASSPDNVPATVRRMIVSELDRLSLSGRKLLEAAAVIGDPFDLDLAAATARTSDDALELIDELVSRDLVKPTTVPRRFQFRHPLVRNAVYESILPGGCLAYHAAAAAALESAGDPPSAVATHLEHSARFADNRAIDTLTRAGDEAIAQAPSSAARWYGAALRILPADSSIESRLSLLRRRAACLAAVGDLDDAHAALDECFTISRQRAGEAPIDITLDYTRLEQLRGRHSDARRLLEDAYERRVDDSSADGVELLVELSTASFHLSDHEAMLESAHRAVVLAAAQQDPALIAVALASQALAYALTGPFDEAMHARDRAARHIDALPDAVISPRLHALASLAEAELYADLFAASKKHAERGVALARRSGRTEFLFVLNPCLGASLCMLGDVDSAASVLDDAVDAARLTRNPQSVCWALMSRTFSALMSGDLDTALALGEESVRSTDSFDRGLIAAFAGATLGLTLLEAGNVERAVDVLLTSGGGNELTGLPGCWRGTGLEALTRGNLLLGRRDDAARAAIRAREQADVLGTYRVRTMADRAEASLALADGRSNDAVRFALSAIAQAEFIGAPLFIAQCRSLAASALTATGHRDDAVAQLRRAAHEFEAVQALRYRDQVEAQLRQLGETVHRRSRPADAGGSGVAALTGRELEVAESVRLGRTNRQIAADLFLSVKTVETHVRNIFNKLGVTSRAQIREALARSETPK